MFFSTVAASFSQSNPILGEWQLVHSEGIDKLRSSAQYRSATPSMREDMELKIRERLENTVYSFISEDSLYYTDYVNYRIIQKKARITISDQVLSIMEGAQTKRAKIVELGEDRLVLEPIVEGTQVGKMIFEPYVKPEN